MIMPALSTVRISWIERCAKLKAYAENIAYSNVLTHGFPAALKPLADLLRVKKVTFVPRMGADGALFPERDGFRIALNCNDVSEIDDLNLRFTFETRNKPLPVRTRFTLAHELAHILFYDTKVNPPRQIAAARNKKNRSKLESACNRLAATMLLPKRALLAAISEAQLYEPNALRRLTRITCVADKTLAIRIAEYYIDGGLICLIREGNKYIPCSFHASIMFRNYFNLEGIGQILTNRDFIINGGSKVTITEEVRAASSIAISAQNFEFTSETFSLKTPPPALFVTFKRLGQPFFVS